MHAGVLVVYLLALVGVGALKARRVRTQEDFTLAGRGLGAAVLTGTLLATWIGTGSVFGNAQKAFEDGLAAWILPLSSAVGILVLFTLAGRLRGMERFTIQDILEDRFGVAARVLGTVVLLGSADRPRSSPPCPRAGPSPSPSAARGSSPTCSPPSC